MFPAQRDPRQVILLSGTKATGFEMVAIHRGPPTDTAGLGVDEFPVIQADNFRVGIHTSPFCVAIHSEITNFPSWPGSQTSLSSSIWDWGMHTSFPSIWHHRAILDFVKRRPFTSSNSTFWANSGINSP